MASTFSKMAREVMRVGKVTDRLTRKVGAIERNSSRILDQLTRGPRSCSRASGSPLAASVSRPGARRKGIGGASFQGLEDSLGRIAGGADRYAQSLKTVNRRLARGVEAQDLLNRSLLRGADSGRPLAEVMGRLDKGFRDAGGGVKSLTDDLAASSDVVSRWGETAARAMQGAGAGMRTVSADLEAGAGRMEGVLTERLPAAGKTFSRLMTEGTDAAAEGFRMFGDVAIGSTTRLEKVASRALGGVGKALTGLINGTTSAKDAFRGLAKSILADLGRMATQPGALGGFGGFIGQGMKFLGIDFNDILGWLPFEHGGVVRSGRVQRFAHGGIVRRPTLFPMAKGMGLMGEAGPEAVMPLARLPGGDLGVRAVGGGESAASQRAPMVVNVHSHGTTPVTAGAQASHRGGDVKVMVDVIENELANRNYRRGRLAQSMEHLYGLSRAGR